MTRRKPLSRKVRFEVFKRDLFTCQYCGRKSPDVVLNVDHIEPVSKGGTNELLNLVTSCFDCNQGKKARRIGDSTELEVQRKQLELIQERRNQLKMLKEWRDECNTLEMEMLTLVKEAVELEFNRSLNEIGERKFTKYIKKFGLQEVLECIRIASESYDEVETGLGMVPGIAVNRERERKRPGSGRAAYVLGILRNRHDHINEARFWAAINEAIDKNVDIASVEEIAKNSDSFNAFMVSIDCYNAERNDAED